MAAGIRSGLNKRIVDETGNRHYKLVVLKFAYTDHRGACWECQCDCGNIVIVRGANLRRKLNPTESCGCASRKPQAARTYVYSSTKSLAKVRGIEFSLSEEEFCDLTVRSCWYCGEPPSLKRKSRSGFTEYVYNGLDRMDSDRGYEIDNVVACCKTCNYAKRKLSVSEFLTWAQKVHTYQEQKKHNRAPRFGEK